MVNFLMRETIKNKGVDFEVSHAKSCFLTHLDCLHKVLKANMLSIQILDVFIVYSLYRKIDFLEMSCLQKVNETLGLAEKASIKSFWGV